jgi:hypothetical protein
MNRCRGDSPGLIPLSHVALKTGVTVDELARRLHDRIVTTDVGIRCLTAEHARAALRIFVDHDADKPSQSLRR